MKCDNGDMFHTETHIRQFLFTTCMCVINIQDISLKAVCSVGNHVYFTCNISMIIWIYTMFDSSETSIDCTP